MTPAGPAASPATVSVVICTFRRPALLIAAVRSVRAQRLDDGTAMTIVVVDNAPEGDAAAGIAALAAEPGAPILYRHVAEPNIAAARNAGVAATPSDLVAFLDDDERAEPGWLAALLATARGTDADIVMGAVLADFVDGPPGWDGGWAGARRWHERRLALPTGSTIGPRHDARLSGRWIGTGNSLFRRATCFPTDAPFDPALGQGGEDTALLLRLHRAGRRIVWCAGAVVHEVVPHARAGAGYLAARAGQSAGRAAAIAVAAAPRPAVAGVMVSARAAVQALGRLVLLAAAPHAPDRRIRLAQSWGKMRWWRRRDRP